MQIRLINASIKCCCGINNIWDSSKNADILAEIRRHILDYSSGSDEEVLYGPQQQSSVYFMLRHHFNVHIFIFVSVYNAVLPFIIGFCHSMRNGLLCSISELIVPVKYFHFEPSPSVNLEAFLSLTIIINIKRCHYFSTEAVCLVPGNSLGK